MEQLVDRWDEGLAVVGALVAFVAGFLPWFRAAGPTTGTEFFGPLVPMLAIGALASLAFLDRTSGPRLLLGAIGVTMIGLVFLVYEETHGGTVAVSITWGGYLVLAGGAALAVAGTFPVLLEPAET